MPLPSVLSRPTPATAVQPRVTSHPWRRTCKHRPINRQATGPSVVELATAAAEPVAKVAALAGAGALCSRAGVLDGQGRRMLSTLILNVFTPALLFNKLGSSLDLHEALRSWPLAVNMLLLSVGGLLLGAAQAALVPMPPQLRTPTLVMSSLGNVGNLPLVLVPTLAANPAVGPLDSEEGLRYVLLTFFWACFMQFPLGYTLFRGAARQQQQQLPIPASKLQAQQQQHPTQHQQQPHQHHQQQEETAVPPAGGQAGSRQAPSAPQADTQPQQQPQDAPGITTPYLSRGSDPAAAAAPPTSATAAGCLADSSNTATNTDPTNSSASYSMAAGTPQSSSSLQVAAVYADTTTKPLSTGSTQQGQHPATATAIAGSSSAADAAPWRLIAANVLSPPTLACLAAAGVGALPQLQQALFQQAGSLHVLGDAAGMLGQPLVPCLFLVLGSNLAEGPGATKVPAGLVVSMVASKLVLHPVAGLALLLGLREAGWLPPSVDGFELLVMAVVWATPSAVLVHSLATMLQVQAGAVSSLLFWEYLCALVTLPLFLLLLLELFQSGALGPV